MIQGIDVSSYQSATFDTTGLAFVIVKRTEGHGYVNPMAAAQVAHGRAHGLVIGHYHYPHIHDGAATDADYFLAHLGTDLHAGDLLVLDWEWYGQTGVTSAEADAFKDEWLARVKAKAPGHRVLTYSDRSNWLTVDKNSNCGDGLWIATAGRPAGSPGIQDPWVIHQYSTAGGIDHDVANFASQAALAAWAAGATPQPQEADMQLSDQITLGSWVPQHWPDDKGLADRKIPVGLALGSGYAHARIAHENSDQILGMLAKMQAQEAAQTAAITAMASALGKVDAAVDVPTLVAQVKAAVDEGVAKALDGITIQVSASSNGA